jgi:hypothetical protein
MIGGSAGHEGARSRDALYAEIAAGAIKTRSPNNEDTGIQNEAMETVLG